MSRSSVILFSGDIAVVLVMPEMLLSLVILTIAFVSVMHTAAVGLFLMVGMLLVMVDGDYGFEGDAVDAFLFPCADACARS